MVVVALIIIVFFVGYFVLKNSKEKENEETAKEMAKLKQEEEEWVKRNEAEEQWKQDLRTGKINILEETNRINHVLENYHEKLRENLKELDEKYNLFREFQRVVKSGGSGDEFFAESEIRFGCYPVDAVRYHRLVDFPEEMLNKLKLIHEIKNDYTISSSIERWEEVKNIYYEAVRIQRNFDRSVSLR